MEKNHSSLNLVLKTGNAAKENAVLLQKALDTGGSIRVEQPGLYEVEGPLQIGDDTELLFESGIILRRVGGNGKPFLVNQGIFAETWNHHIRIEGLHLQVNGMDPTHYSILPGLRGQLAFMGVRDLVIRDYKVLDLAKLGYGILFCRFEDILLERLQIEGDKDGIHLDNGRRFTIRDCQFATYDDAIALNAYDYGLSTADYGNVEDGLVENCHDFNRNSHVGYFCRMLTGVWTDWKKGMKVQNSTMVVHDGRLYTACLPIPPREEPIVSLNPPTHTSGIQEVDGIPWRYVRKHDGKYEAVCRNITFRNIFLHKPRVGFGLTYEINNWADSAPAGLALPVVRDIALERIQTDPEYSGILIAGGGAAENVRISDSVLAGRVVQLYGFPHLSGKYPCCDFTFSGVKFSDAEMFVEKAPYDRLVSVRCLNCSGTLRTTGSVKAETDSSVLKITE